MSDITNGSVDAGNPSQTATDTNTAAEAKWYSGIQDEGIRGFAELKGWRDAGEAVKSYQHLEKLAGLPPERLARIPDTNDADGWKAFNQKFGWAAPEKAEEYKLPVPEGQNDAFARHMENEFHKLGIPADKARAIVEANNAYWGESAKNDETRIAEMNQQAGMKLKQEWGANYDELSQLAERAFKELGPKTGLSEDQFGLLEDVLGPAGVAKLWAGIGSSLGEAKFITSDKGATAVMTPAAAQARLDQLKYDREWFGRFEKGGQTERSEYNRLVQIVASAG